MHFLTSSTKDSKIYSLKPYAIPINNDLSHEAMSQNPLKEEKQIAEKKQIQKIMHSIVKERMFSNFIKQDTRTSEDNYSKIDRITKIGFRSKAKTERTSRNFRMRDLHRTIETREDIGRKMETIECSQLMTSYGGGTNNFGNRVRTSTIAGTRRFSVKKPAAIEAISKTLEIPSPIQRTATKELKAQKIPPLLHPIQLKIPDRQFSDFYRKLVGITSSQFIYDYKLSREQIYQRYKSVLDAKLIERFFHFFGFPNAANIRQYIQFIENAANTNLRFIYFWVFVLLDENGNGVLTNQDFFRTLQKFNENPYIEEEVYLLVRWLQKHKFRVGDTEPTYEESLTANKNLRLEELNELLKQTTLERIDVNCVKNTCYHQTILSLEHSYTERQKMNQLENTEETTKKLKKVMYERKKKIQNQPRIRLRDFYTIFNNKRPKIFCYFLKLLAGIVPQDYE